MHQIRPLLVPIPKFDEESEKHIKLAEISINAHKKIEKELPRLTTNSIGRTRTQVRELLKDEIKEIDEIVKELIGKNIF